MPYNGSDLTGSIVKEARERHKLSRVSFSTLAGLAGKSTARLYNRRAGRRASRDDIRHVTRSSGRDQHARGT
jgi:hypothetical protein